MRKGSDTLLHRAIATSVVAGATVAVFSLAGCTTCPQFQPCSPESLAGVVYTPLAGEWPVSSPEAQGLDPTSVAQLYCKASQLDRIHSVLVVKNGLLVAEDYFNGSSVDDEALLQSVTKSVTSALVGIALQRGCLTDRQQKMLDFFPDVAPSITDSRKRQITIEQMLQMRAGYPWEETDARLWDGLLSGHYLPLIESFPLTADPGTTFQYSNLTANWLGIIVDRSCGQRLAAFADEQLFSPIDAVAGDWRTDWDGHNNGCCDLHLTARDAARFGQLYLDDGVYRERQVMPADWVRDSLRSYSRKAWSNIGDFHDIGYGYMWWNATVGEHRVNFAWGHGGQLIVLVADLDLMVVVTADPFWLEHNDDSWCHERTHFRLVGDFISSLPPATATP